MTNEEKAEEYVRTLRVAGINSYNHCNVEKAYLDGLEEGEKEISELKELIEVKKLEKLELKAQNEKMKNFYNCAHSSRALCPNGHKCSDCIDWELAE